MEFGSSITNPLLKLAVSTGEPTIRQACEIATPIAIHVEMDQFPDGRDAIRITLRSPDAFAGFCMLLRKYFDPVVLLRVARHAWQRRMPCGHPELRMMPVRVASASWN